MESSYLIRAAKMDDCVRIAELVRRSITELCEADHNGNEGKIKIWMKNKTLAQIQNWQASNRFQLFVREHKSKIAAVGCHDQEGQILLNYVSPEHQFHGHSKAMLTHLETSIGASGLKIAHLVTTSTAIGFYQNQGWKKFGNKEACMGVIGQPMYKNL